jgi:hypothetical protein
MNNTSLTELSLEELKKEEKKRKGIHISYCIIIGMMIGVSVYGTIKKGDINFFTLMPLFFLPIYFGIWKSYKDVRNEIKSRQSN